MRTGGNSFAIYDLKGVLVKELKSNIVIDGRDTSSPAAALDNVHIDNFLKCIRAGGTLNADVEVGHKSTLWFN